MKKSCFLLLASCFLLLASCKKTSLVQPESQFMIEHPLLRVDNLFPDGVLQFKSKESFATFYKQLQNNSIESKNLLPKNFASLRKYLNNFQVERSAVASQTSITDTENSQDGIEDVGLEQYLYDMRLSLIEDSCQVDILNEDLQIIVGQYLYQLTRIGTFEVENQSIPQFIDFVNANENNIYFNPNYNSVPNETSLGNNTYQVFDGVERIQNLNDILDPVDPWGGGGFGSGGGGFTPPNNTGLPTNFQYQTHFVGSDFNLSKEIYMSSSRRFKFETFINDFLGVGLINTVGIRGKLQRERRFLGMQWWGESYADEIIVGCDNMDLMTDYTFPTPQSFTSLAYPVFDGETDFELGNNILKMINVRVNINVLGQQINNNSFNSFVNGQLNSFINNQYNNYFTSISNEIITLIDPTFVSRYANYTKRINSLKEANKYRFTISKGERIQGYSHVNVWRFNYNFGSPGTTYGYDMKTGSFFGRCRVANQWYGIRIIKQL